MIHDGLIHLILMFVLMILLQTFVMPYYMTESPAHVYFTPSQVYMGTFMGACMIGIDGLLNPLPWWIWMFAILTGVASVVGYRWQIGISDQAWMREMIPHHSMALLTSKQRLNSPDPFVARLSEQILSSQSREIVEMQAWLKHRS